MAPVPPKPKRSCTPGSAIWKKRSGWRNGWRELRSKPCAKQKIGNRVTLVGNVHAVNDLFQGTPATVRVASQQCIQEAGGGRGLILGSGCLVPRNTPIDNVREMVRLARSPAPDVESKRSRVDRILIYETAIWDGRPPDNSQVSFQHSATTRGENRTFSGSLGFCSFDASVYCTCIRPG